MRIRTPVIRFATAAMMASGLVVAGVAHGDVPLARPVPSDRPVADIACDRGSLPESQQGRVTAAEVASGRSAKGYTCNTAQVGHYGSSGGFHVERYDDAAGHSCAYMDSTLLFPKDVAGPEGPGVFVLDMHDPSQPVRTAVLTTPAMLSPHESLRVNAHRGLLAADMGYSSFNPGFVDIYDLTQDCRHPVLKSSTPLGVVGHESGWSPDGRTFWVAGSQARELTALDVSNPSLPVVLWMNIGHWPHAVTLSPDGKRLYLADQDDPFSGLVILDVSQIQDRVANPQVPEVSRLTWPEVSIPQVAMPFTSHGHRYVAEVDEFSKRTRTAPTAAQPVQKEHTGAARIIDIADERNPYVVANIRLAVHNTSNHQGPEATDPGNGDVAQEYAGHYCSIPTPVDPTIMACSMILSGLRIFDIRDPRHPREIAYFNGQVLPGKPGSAGTPGLASQGAFAMSSPAYNLEKHQIWYTDGRLGFYAVRLTGAAATIAGTGTHRG